MGGGIAIDYLPKNLTVMRRLTLSVLALFITGLLVFIACRKQDQTTLLPDSAIEKKFFTIPAGTHEDVKAIAALIKRQNKKSHFVEDLVRRVGYPYWETAMMIKNDKTGVNGRSGSGDAEYVVIPFAIAEQEQTRSSLVVRLNSGDTTLKMLYPKQYTDFGFESNMPDDFLARDVFNLFVSFDKALFNHNKFRIRDERLLTSETKNFLTQRNLAFQEVKVIYSVSSNNSGRINTQLPPGCNTYDICYINMANDQCLSCESGSCDYYIQGLTMCTNLYYVMGDDGGTGGGGGGGGTGGGSGGGGGCTTCDPDDWATDPCIDDGTNDPAEFCDNPDGWEHQDDNLIQDPCVIAQKAAKKMDSAYIKSNSDSLIATITDLASGLLERGFPIYKKFRVNSQDVTDTTITTYICGDVQTGTDSNIEFIL